MFLSFRDFTLLEAVTDKTVYMVFGRFNPVTNAHRMLFEELGKIAKKNNGIAFVFTSHTQDKKKNPLDYTTKIKYLKKLAPNGVKVIESKARNAAEVLTELGNNLGYKRAVMLTGSDRTDAYEKFKKYLKDFNLESLEIMTIGKQRNETSDDLDGMSASKMRQTVVDGREKDFIEKAPFDAKTNKQLYDDVKKGMGL